MRRAYAIDNDGEGRFAKRQRMLIATGQWSAYPRLPNDLLWMILDLLPIALQCVWRCVSKGWNAHYPMGKWNRTTAMLCFTSDAAYQDLVIFAVRNWRWSVMVKGEMEVNAWSRIARAGSYKILSRFARHSNFITFDGGCKLPRSIRCQILKETRERAPFDAEHAGRLFQDALWYGDVDTCEWLLSTDPTLELKDASSAITRMLEAGWLSVYRHYYELGIIKSHLHMYALFSARSGNFGDFEWARKIIDTTPGATRWGAVELGRCVLVSGHIWREEFDQEIREAIKTACATKNNHKCEYWVCNQVVFIQAMHRHNWGVMARILSAADNADRQFIVGYACQVITHPLQAEYLRRVGAKLDYKAVCSNLCGSLSNPDNVDLARYLQAIGIPARLRIDGAIESLKRWFVQGRDAPMGLLKLLATAGWVIEYNDRREIAKLLIAYQPSAIEYCFSLGLLTASAVLGVLDLDKGPYHERAQFIPSRCLYTWCLGNLDTLIDGATYPTEDEKLKAKERYLELIKARLAHKIGVVGKIGKRGRSLESLSFSLLKRTKRVERIAAKKQIRTYTRG